MLTTTPIAEVFAGQQLTIDGRRFAFQIMEPNDDGAHGGLIWPFYGKRQNKITPSAEPLLQPPSQTSPQHILNILPVEILQQIFEDDQLDLIDLHAIANVCQIFRTIAEKVFKRKTRGVLNMLDVFRGETPVWQVDAFLQTFGKSITDVDCKGIPMPEIPFRLALDYCPKITRIAYDHGHDLMLPTLHRPQLTQMHLDGVKLHDRTSTEAFFQANPQLEQLDLSTIQTAFGIEVILRRVPQLQRLNVSPAPACYRWTHFECFRQLKQLNVLRLGRINIDAINNIFDALIDENVQLQRLEIDKFAGNYNQLTDAVCKMTTITSLEMNQAIDDDCMMRISRHLNQLTDIKFDMCSIKAHGIRRTFERMEQLKSVQIRSFPWTTFRMEDIRAIDRMRISRSMDVNVSVQVPRHTLKVCVFIMEYIDFSYIFLFFTLYFFCVFSFLY